MQAIVTEGITKMKEIALHLNQYANHAHISPHSVCSICSV